MSTSPLFDLKPDIQKAIKRLASQKNHEVLRNKLRSWIVTRELNVTDLIRCCREKKVYVPPSILHKIGLLFGQGKEGLNEDFDTAFIFYLAAADLGHAAANGNVAQYYFDGRAPGGKNINLAYKYCHEAIEQGIDKLMLMSEILHERQDYPETVRYLRKIMEYRPTILDDKRKVEARRLEVECLDKQLVRVFVRLSKTIEHMNAQKSPPKISPTRVNRLASSSFDYGGGVSSSPKNMASSSMAAISRTMSEHPITTNTTTMMRCLSLDSTNESVLSAPYFTAPTPFLSSPKPTLSSLSMKSPSSTGGGLLSVLTKFRASSSTPASGTPGRSNTSPRRSLSHAPSSSGKFTSSQPFSPVLPSAPSPAAAAAAAATPAPTHHLPGWVHISPDLEGFDINACGELSLKAHVLSMEWFAMQQAYAASQHYLANLAAPASTTSTIHGSVSSSGGLLLSQPAGQPIAPHVLQYLQQSKVPEFQLLADSVQSQYHATLTAWEEYTDIMEHLLQRQVVVEKQFFHPAYATQLVTYQVAKALLTSRTYNHPHFFQHLVDHTYLPVSGQLNTPICLSNLDGYEEISGKVLVMAERAVLELSRNIYGTQTGYLQSQVTGWLGSGITANPLSQEGSGGGTGGGVGEGGSSSKTKVSQQQMHQALLQEMTFVETLVIGSTVLRSLHRTHPILHDLPLPHQTSSSTAATRGPLPLGIVGTNLSQPYHAPQLTASLSSSSPITSSTSTSSSSSKTDYLLRGNYQQYCVLEDVTSSAPIHAFFHWLVGLPSPPSSSSSSPYDDDPLTAPSTSSSAVYSLEIQEKVKQVIDLIFRFVSTGQPVSVAELQGIANSGMAPMHPNATYYYHPSYDNAAMSGGGGGLVITEAHVHLFMKLCYHYFIQRIIPFVLSSTSSDHSLPSHVGGSHKDLPSSKDLPLATGQIRALQLVKAGYLTWSELFEPTSPYGLFYFDNSFALDLPLTPTFIAHHQPVPPSVLSSLTTSSSDPPMTTHYVTYRQLRQQLINVNLLYQQSLLQLTPENFPAYIQFHKAHPQGVTIPTHKVLLEELGSLYGQHRHQMASGVDEDGLSIGSGGWVDEEYLLGGGEGGNNGVEDEAKFLSGLNDYRLEKILHRLTALS